MSATGNVLGYLPVPVRRTGLVVSVPEAEPLVASFRRRFHAGAVARRIPPHVTILFPFVPATAFDTRARLSVASHFREQRAFDASLAGIGLFPAHVWLAPAPRDRFVDLITATCDRFPDTPPYDGAFDAPEPHLAIGEASDETSVEAVADAADREIAPFLPLLFRVDAATLFEEQADGTWVSTATFPFG